jgi:hypothetical protein
VRMRVGKLARLGRGGENWGVEIERECDCNE